MSTPQAASPAVFNALIEQLLSHAAEVTVPNSCGTVKASRNGETVIVYYCTVPVGACGYTIFTIGDSRKLGIDVCQSDTGEVS